MEQGKFFDPTTGELTDERAASRLSLERRRTLMRVEDLSQGESIVSKEKKNVPKNTIIPPTTTKTVTPLVNIPKFCSRCGRPYNTPISKFCDKCGKPRN